MNKLAAIRIVYEDGTYSDPIPITALMENIQWSESKSLLDVLGEDLNDDGESVKDKFDRLKSLVNNIITFIDNIPEWTKQSEKPTYTAQEVGALPVSSIDETLKIQGAAADAKITGDEINSLKNGINNIGTLSDLNTEYKDDLVGAINEISAISAIDEAESARQAAAEAVSAATEITNRLNEIQPTLDEVQEVISSISSQTKASKDVFGIVKIGDNLNIQDGVLSADPPGSNIDIDSVINSTSTNPVQNKIINAALENKVNKDGNKVLSTNDYTTAEKDKGSGKTFSHRENKRTSLREDKRIADSMIRCPKNKNRAGLYDVITIKDEDGEEYTHKLELHDKDVPEVFRLFRGKVHGSSLTYKGYTYKLIRIEKETSNNKKEK